MVLIIYLIGCIVSAICLYKDIEKGTEITFLDLVVATVFSLCSWVAFVTMLIIVFGDKVIFKK